MILGFTGTQSFGPGELARVNLCLQGLADRLEPTTVVTGGCVGIDAYVHGWFGRERPDVRRIVVVPSNRSKVYLPVLTTADEVVEMPSDSDYRARNVEMVRRADTMAAFWTGKTRFSGTWMTMNIAAKQRKLAPENVFGMRLLSDEEARSRYFFQLP